MRLHKKYPGKTATEAQRTQKRSEERKPNHEGHEEHKGKKLNGARKMTTRFLPGLDGFFYPQISADIHGFGLVFFGRCYGKSGAESIRRALRAVTIDID